MKTYKHISIFLFLLLLKPAVGLASRTNGYFKNIDALTDFDWVAYFPKLKANGWETIEIAETNLKQLWKKAFTAKAEDMFKPVNQGGLGPAKMNQLFKLPGMEDIEDAGEFINLLNNNTAFRNNALKFIKIE